MRAEEAENGMAYRFARARARARDKGFVVRAARAAFVCRSAGPANASPFSINLLLSRRLYLDGL